MNANTTNHPESIDPHDRQRANLFVRAEHLARYLYAAGFIRKRRLNQVLDCACGSGYGSVILAEKAESVCAVDRSAAHMERLKELTAEKAIGSVTCHRADLNAGLGMFGPDCFDCVACFETLEHVEQEEFLLREFARVLRRGRWLLLSVPKAGYEPADAGGRPENPWHLRLYQEVSLAETLTRCGFAVERTLGQPYTNLSRANMEGVRRDAGLTYEKVDSYFNQSPEALDFYARVWGWPVDENHDKSSVLFLVCRKK